MVSVAGSTSASHRSCSPWRSRCVPRSLIRPGTIAQPVSRCRRSPFVDASGISQVAWRSIPCLCPAPRPRPGRQVLAPSGLVDAAPGSDTPKASAGTQSRGLPQGFSIRCLRFTNSVATAHARLASGWRAAPLPGGCRTLWIALKGFRLLPSSFPGLRLTQTECE